MKNICHSDNDLMNILSLFTHLIVTFLCVVFKMELNDLLMYIENVMLFDIIWKRANKYFILYKCLSVDWNFQNVNF